MKKAVVNLSLLSLNIGVHSLNVKSAGDGYGDSLNSLNAVYEVLENLLAPVITLEGDIVKAILLPSDAEKFAVFADNVEMEEKDNTSFDLSNYPLSTGKHVITMRARDVGYNKDGMSLYSVGHNESVDSNAVTYEVYAGTTGLGYELVDNSYYICLGIGTATSTDIAISSKVLGKPVKAIKNNAFEDNKTLTSVLIPGSVLTIGDYAFCKCNKIRSLTIAEGVQSIGAYAFQKCGENNIVIPGSVKTIGNYAFWTGAIVTITLSSGLEVIGEGAFATLPSLKSIKIPATVTSIGKWGFNGCTQLATIEYEGTKSQWNAITKGEEWNLNVPATQVVCSNGTVAL